MKDTLGYHRDMCAAVFGEDSPATKWLDEKIASHERGRDEPVVVHETQVVLLLSRIHFGDMQPPAAP